MDDRDRQLLHQLLTESRVATLAVLLEGRPFASLVPYAVDAGLDCAWIHASQLARHTRGLTEGAPYSLLIHQPDSQPDTNPAQLARMTLQGTVKVLDRDGEEYLGARSVYLAKFPKSEITFQLGDFRLYRLSLDRCRFVAGFGKTFDLEAEELRLLV